MIGLKKNKLKWLVIGGSAVIVLCLLIVFFALHKTERSKLLSDWLNTTDFCSIELNKDGTYSSIDYIISAEEGTWRTKLGVLYLTPIREYILDINSTDTAETPELPAFEEAHPYSLSEDGYDLTIYTDGKPRVYRKQG